MASYGAKEARIDRSRKPRVNLCGSCGEDIDANELLCAACRKPTVESEDEVNQETRRGR